MEERVKDLIRNELYSAFSDVKKPTVLNSCTCCHSESEKQTMLNNAPRNIPLALIDELELSWLCTFGCEEDVHYFAPCMVDVILSGGYSDPEFIYELFVRSGLYKWPEKQKHAVKRAYSGIYKHRHLPVPDEIKNL